MTEEILLALEERRRGRDDARQRFLRFETIFAGFGLPPLLDASSSDEIVGYDEVGAF
jgi:hypothetical protein